MLYYYRITMKVGLNLISKEAREVVDRSATTKARYFRFKHRYKEPYQLSVWRGKDLYVISFGFRYSYVNKYTGQKQYAYNRYYDSCVFDTYGLRKYRGKIPIVLDDWLQTEVTYNKIKQDLIKWLKLK